jgi:hypothetical protein
LQVRVLPGAPRAQIRGYVVVALLVLKSARSFLTP